MPIGKCYSYYNYKLTNTKPGPDCGEYKYKMTTDITNKWGIPRPSIYLLLKNDDKVIKWQHFKIEKIKEPAFKVIYYN
tara:strand:- start:77 stop:310 length:234 start_codon:yes stop_codon:yes gene_type:complete